MMLSDPGGTGWNLFAAMFSDEPAPDVDAAIVVAHPGDEAASASWLMVRLQERASVYCLTTGSLGCSEGVGDAALMANGVAPSGSAIAAAAAVAGVPAGQCHTLGLHQTELASDLETLVWLTAAAITAARPRVLVTHACEGRNLDHDATSFAVHMTARLMARSGGAPPLVIELPGRAADAADELLISLRQAVRIEFGPESRKVKRRMLLCHGDCRATVGSAALDGESYLLATTGGALESLATCAGAYLDAPWCAVDDFRRNALATASALTPALLSPPSRA